MIAGQPEVFRGSGGALLAEQPGRSRLDTTGAASLLQLESRGTGTSHKTWIYQDLLFIQKGASEN